MESLNQKLPCPPSPAITGKRSCPRYPFSSAAEAIDIQADTRIFGRLSDIARNGCYMDTISPFAKDALVKLTISRDHESFQTEARVIYSMVGMGMGLFFTTAEPHQLRVLTSWLEELGGTKISEGNPPNIIFHPEPPPKRSDHELRNILTELVALLNCKNVLNDSEGMALLRKLSR